MKQSLEQASLLQNDTETGDIKVHRLIQTVVRDSMDAKETNTRFEDAAILIKSAFPRVVSAAEPNNYQSAMWHDAQECLPHVANLEDLYKKLVISLPPGSAFPRLLSDTCW